MAAPEQNPERPKTAGPRLKIMLVASSDAVGGHVREVIGAHDDMDLAVDVKDGVSAVSALRHQSVDAVILDVGDPSQNIRVTLSRLAKVDPDIKVVMVASLSFASVKASMQGLMEGAAEFVPTPTAHSKSSSTQEFAARLTAIVRALGKSERDVSTRPARRRAPVPQARPAPEAAPAPLTLRPVPALAPEVLAIGSSTGGPQALFAVISALPLSLDLPILITQHMPPTFTALLAEHISKHSGRNCREGVDGEPVVKGRLYLAPGDRHMTVTETDGVPTIRLDDGPPVNFCKPAVDPMLSSLAKVFDGKVLDIILTGMGSDGLGGSEAIADAGGMVIAQDEATSVVWGMPRAVAEAGLCSAVLPVDEIGPFVGKFLKAG